MFACEQDATVSGNGCNNSYLKSQARASRISFYLLTVDNNVVDVICEDCRQQVLRGPMDL